MKQYVKAEADIDCFIKEAGGRGNCFYRSIQELLGNNPDDYMSLKEMVHEYAKRHRPMTRTLGNPKKIEARIINDARRARYEDIFITANFLKREIHLYIENYPHGTCYRMSVKGTGPLDPPLRVLHTGNIYNGHFRALVPLHGNGQYQAPNVRDIDNDDQYSNSGSNKTIDYFLSDTESVTSTSSAANASRHESNSFNYGSQKKAEVPAQTNQNSINSNSTFNSGNNNKKKEK